ncbi:response regulator, partial [Vibrio parahaemolyticus]|nr:response regulator [Vibrio parahaemolyticus]
SLDYYFAKPLKGEELRQSITSQLTAFVIENDDYLLSWTTILDSEAILNAIADRRASFGE